MFNRNRTRRFGPPGDNRWPQWLYHAKKAPRGQVFDRPEDAAKLGRGWVDSPAKFPKPSRLESSLVTVKPWWERWEWIAKAVSALLGIITGAVTLLKVILGK